MSTWPVFAEQIRGLNGRHGFGTGSLEFLAFVVDPETGKVFDRIRKACVDDPETLYILLAHYAKAEPVERVGKLVKFTELPSGYAYERAFEQRAIIPIAESFGRNPKMLVRAARLLDGLPLRLGDASVEVPALPKIPLTYVLWTGGDELQPSSSIFFDVSAGHYLPTEDLAVLGQITSRRLTDALGKIER